MADPAARKPGEPSAAANEPAGSHSLPRSGDPFRDLVALMARLRTPGTGCPWDIEQTFETIAPYTIEEAYEVADAIERRDMGELKGELGDLLFQSVFHARMAEEAGAFTIDDVVRSLVDKMIARHPHVFGSAKVDSAEAQTGAWEVMKAAERAEKAAREAKAGTTGPPSALDGVALALPALMRAEKLTKRAGRVGFDWPSAEPVLDKLQEEIGELQEAIAEPQPDKAHVAEELGDILFVVANLCRKLEVDPEEALRQANAKFVKRFSGMEGLARQRGLNFASLSLDEQESLWVDVKKAERGER
ncbi:MAG TPA: nucleoside triphosphate pyrophosphohydrolase [Hyphomonadaceae bacterium]|nr:nucleoside triphosphate pyrophosphohydrolase [Hyphomonadaceae bacterium]